MTFAPQANPVYLEPVLVPQLRDELYPRGFRKLLGMILVMLATIFPAVNAWKNPPAVSPTRPSFGPPPLGRINNTRFGRTAEKRSSFFSLNTAVSFFTKAMAFIMTAVGMMIYFPRSGFKRYALVAAVWLPIAVPWALSAYLSGRTSVYRSEIFLVSLTAAAPGLAMYVLLVAWAGKRRGWAW
jgi:hypothetical protein